MESTIIESSSEEKENEPIVGHKKHDIDNLLQCRIRGESGSWTSVA